MLDRNSVTSPIPKGGKVVELEARARGGAFTGFDLALALMSGGGSSESDWSLLGGGRAAVLPGPLTGIRGGGPSSLSEPAAFLAGVFFEGATFFLGADGAGSSDSDADRETVSRVGISAQGSAFWGVAGSGAPDAALVFFFFFFLDGPAVAAAVGGGGAVVGAVGAGLGLGLARGGGGGAEVVGGKGTTFSTNGGRSYDKSRSISLTSFHTMRRTLGKAWLLRLSARSKRMS